MKHFGKRGTHVGVVISFNLFIIFLLSVFLLINPVLKVRGEKQPVLDSLYPKILENISSNMTLTLVKVENGYSPTLGNCIEISGGGWESGENITVKNLADERIESNISSLSVNLNWTDEPRFLKIYSSLESFEDMPLSSGSCDVPSEGADFSIKSIKTEKYVFESSILRLNASYNPSSYQDLKEYFDIPLEEEFGFRFINSEGITEVEAGRVPNSISVYSKKKYVNYVTNQSKILPGIIIVKIW